MNEDASARRRRVRQQGVRRSHRVAIAVDDAEHVVLENAARAEGITISAYVADRALTAARSAVSVSAGPLREALSALCAATVQVQKAGTNLNQAVAALNATGQPSPALTGYARYTARVIERLDEAAQQVRRRLP